jgi:hypothetical protein
MFPVTLQLLRCSVEARQRTAQNPDYGVPPRTASNAPRRDRGRRSPSAPASSEVARARMVGPFGPGVKRPSVPGRGRWAHAAGASGRRVRPRGARRRQAGRVGDGLGDDILPKVHHMHLRPLRAPEPAGRWMDMQAGRNRRLRLCEAMYDHAGEPWATAPGLCLRCTSCTFGRKPIGAATAGAATATAGAATGTLRLRRRRSGPRQ